MNKPPIETPVMDPYTIMVIDGWDDRADDGGDRDDARGQARLIALGLHRPGGHITDVAPFILCEG